MRVTEVDGAGGRIKKIPHQSQAHIRRSQEQHDARGRGRPGRRRAESKMPIQLVAMTICDEEMVWHKFTGFVHCLAFRLLRLTLLSP